MKTDPHPLYWRTIAARTDARLRRVAVVQAIAVGVVIFIAGNIIAFTFGALMAVVEKIVHCWLQFLGL